MDKVEKIASNPMIASCADYDEKTNELVPQTVVLAVAAPLKQPPPSSASRSDDRYSLSGATEVGSVSSAVSHVYATKPPKPWPKKSSRLVLAQQESASGGSHQETRPLGKQHEHRVHFESRDPNDTTCLELGSFRVSSSAAEDAIESSKSEAFDPRGQDQSADKTENQKGLPISDGEGLPTRDGLSRPSRSETTSGASEKALTITQTGLSGSENQSAHREMAPLARPASQTTSTPRQRPPSHEPSRERASMSQARDGGETRSRLSRDFFDQEISAEESDSESESESESESNAVSESISMHMDEYYVNTYPPLLPMPRRSSPLRGSKPPRQSIKLPQCPAPPPPRHQHNAREWANPSYPLPGPTHNPFLENDYQYNMAFNRRWGNPPWDPLVQGRQSPLAYLLANAESTNKQLQRLSFEAEHLQQKWCPRIKDLKRRSDEHSEAIQTLGTLSLQQKGVVEKLMESHRKERQTHLERMEAHEQSVHQELAGLRQIILDQQARSMNQASRDEVDTTSEAPNSVSDTESTNMHKCKSCAAQTATIRPPEHDAPNIYHQEVVEQIKQAEKVGSQRQEDNKSLSGLTRYTYRELAVFLLSHASIAKLLVAAARLYTNRFKQLFATQLKAILEDYIGRLGHCIASNMEAYIYSALYRVFDSASDETWLRLASLIESLSKSTMLQIHRRGLKLQELVKAVNSFADGDVYARMLDKGWIVCFSSEQANSYLLGGGPGRQLERDLTHLLVPKAVDSSFLATAAQRLISEGAETGLLHVVDDISHCLTSSLRVNLDGDQRSIGRKWLNRWQVDVENLTDAPWEWWPLAPPPEQCKEGYSILSWICVCGELRSCAVPMEFATIVFTSLYRHRTHDPIRSEADLPLSLQRSRANTEGEANTANDASQGRSASEFTDIERDSFLAPINTPTKSDRWSTSSNPSIWSAETAVGSQNDSDDYMQRYVFLALRVGQNYRLRQIVVYNVGDVGFFKALRRDYRKGKGWIRRLFSVWKFAHCEFTMLEKIAENEIVPRPEAASVPPNERKDYAFMPRPPEVLPPISTHEFNRRFYAKRGSTFRSSNKSCLTTRAALQRIPKRDIEVTEEGDERDIFWDLLAIDKISFFSVAVYHSLLLLPPLLFWIFWMTTGRSNDFQNASVPFLAALGCISLFWFPLLR